jgi:hypothetical protein
MPAVPGRGRAIELAQFFLGEAPHEIGHVHFAGALTRPTLEAISVEEAHEQFEIGILAVVGRRGRQHEMPRASAHDLAELVALGVLHFAAEQARGHAVGFITDREVPVGGGL